MAGGRPSLEEQLQTERDPAVPDSDLLTTTSLVRRRLLTGAVISPREVAQEYGVHPSFLTQVVLSLRRLGFEVEHVSEEGSAAVSYRLANPEFEPPAKVFAAIRRERAKESKAKRERAAAPRAAPVAVTQESPPPPPEQHWSSNYTPDLPPLPGLGDGVLVYALALNDDGTVTLGLRNGSRRWMTTVTGATEVTP